MFTGRVEKIHFTHFNENDDLIEPVKRAARAIIGALKHVVVGHYKERKYTTIKLNGHFETVSCTGNIALDEERQTIVHAHIVVSNEKGERESALLAAICFKETALVQQRSS